MAGIKRPDPSEIEAFQDGFYDRAQEERGFSETRLRRFRNRRLNAISLPGAKSCAYGARRRYQLARRRSRHLSPEASPVDRGELRWERLSPRAVSSILGELRGQYGPNDARDAEAIDLVSPTGWLSPRELAMKLGEPVDRIVGVIQSLEAQLLAVRRSD